MATIQQRLFILRHGETQTVTDDGPGMDSAFIAEKLGPLAVETNEARRLRATLKGFFDANSNLRAAGTCLGIHHNTVRYRLERAEALLGRSVREHRLHLEIALQLFDRLVLPTNHGI